MSMIERVGNARPARKEVLLRLIAHELFHDQAEELIGFAALIKPSQVFAAIAAARGLPEIILKPWVFIGGGAADIATGREFETAD